MTEILGIIQCLLISLICYLEFKNKSSAVFLWATLLIMFGVMHLITSINGDFEYNNIVLQNASIFVIIFCMFYFSIRVLTSYKNSLYIYIKTNFNDIVGHNKSCDRLLFFILLCIGLWRIWSMIWYADGILNTSWATMRSYSKTLNYMNFNQLFTIIFFSLSGLPLLFALKKERLLCLYSVLLILLNVLITRNRIEILPIFCSFIALFIIKTQKLSLKTIIYGSVIAFIVIFLIYSLRVFRHYGSISAFISEFNFGTFTCKVLEYIATGNGELGLRRVFYYFLACNNDFPGFGEGASYIRMLLVFIPTRWSLGLKPDDFAIIMGSAIGMGPGGSTHPTLFGDCFANLGMYGVLLGIFWGIYATSMDYITIKRKTKTGQVLLFVLNCVTYCIIGRGSVYNAFFICAWGISLIVLFEFIFIKFLRRLHFYI